MGLLVAEAGGVEIVVMGLESVLRLALLLLKGKTVALACWMLDGVGARRFLVLLVLEAVVLGTVRYSADGMAAEGSRSSSRLYGAALGIQANECHSSNGDVLMRMVCVGWARSESK